MAWEAGKNIYMLKFILKSHLAGMESGRGNPRNEMAIGLKFLLILRWFSGFHISNLPQILLSSGTSFGKGSLI